MRYIFMFLLVIMASSTNSRTTNMPLLTSVFNSNPAEEELEETEIPELTVENLQKELVKAGIQKSDVVLRQAILETGWFKCQKCSMGSNNLFGFFYKGKYLAFDNWVESVAYYKWWQDKLYSGGDYYAFLKKVGYATSPNYIKHLESLKGSYDLIDTRSETVD